MEMTHLRNETFKSRVSRQSTPGIAAGVTGTKERVLGRTQHLMLCAPVQSDHSCASLVASARVFLLQRKTSDDGRPTTVHQNIHSPARDGHDECSVRRIWGNHGWARPNHGPRFALMPSKLDWRSPSRAPDTRLTGPTRVGRPYVR